MELIDVPALDHLVVTLNLNILQLKLIVVILLDEIVVLDVLDFLRDVNGTVLLGVTADAIVSAFPDLSDYLQADIDHFYLRIICLWLWDQCLPHEISLLQNLLVQLMVLEVYLHFFLRFCIQSFYLNILEHIFFLLQQILQAFILKPESRKSI